jgi:hypothetical protein
MGPFGKLTSKLKGQQKDSSKNVKEAIDLSPPSPTESAHVPGNASQQADGKAVAEGRNKAYVEGLLHDKGKLHSGAIVGSSQASHRRPDSSLPAKVTRRAHADSMARKNESASVKYEQSGLGDVEGKGSSRESRWMPNPEQREGEAMDSFNEGNRCNPRAKEVCSSQEGEEVKGKGSATGDNGKGAGGSPFPPQGVKSEAMADLDSSSLSLSLGLNRIKTRSGPLHSEAEHKAIEKPERKAAKSDKSIPIPERSSREKVSQLENLGHTQQSDDSGRVKPGAMPSDREGEEYHRDFVDISSQYSHTKMRRKVKSESHRLQRLHSGRNSSDQVPIAATNEILTSTTFSASEMHEKPATTSQTLSAQLVQKAHPKSGDFFFIIFLFMNRSLPVCLKSSVLPLKVPTTPILELTGLN